MALAKVIGTKIRGGTYHLNLTIPRQIRHLYGGALLLTGTLGTSDAKAAANEVTVARGKLIEKAQEVTRASDITARLAALPPEQRALYDEAGGLEGLLKRFATEKEWLRKVQEPPPFEAVPMNRYEQWVEDESEILFEREKTRTLGKIKADARTLQALGHKVETPGGDLSGFAELAESLIRAKSYTIQNADSIRYTVRRWIEFHGDLSLTKLTRAHLAEFDDAARDLPVAREWLKKPMRAAIAAARKGNLDRVSPKVRERLITHLKALVAFATDRGLITADPWTGYKFDRPKIKVSERRAAKVEGFTPDQVKAILAHVAATHNADTVDYWVPMLSAYSGARREELGQLRLDDVLTAGNIPALRITDEAEGQKVKNQHSLRTIPVPPVCIERGFLEFVTRRGSVAQIG